jgi:F420H(2)-dependent quinone reductase
MAYLKPPWFTVKVFNRIAMATGISNAETLTVTKRGNGEPQHIPVVTVGGTRYLVSTRGESQWVKNVRANPTVTLSTKSGAMTYLAREAPTPQRGPILTATRKRWAGPSTATFASYPTRRTIRCSHSPPRCRDRQKSS